LNAILGIAVMRTILCELRYVRRHGVPGLGAFDPDIRGRSKPSRIVQAGSFDAQELFASGAECEQGRATLFAKVAMGDVPACGGF